MVAFYQHDIANWMDGTEGLSDGEYRAYHVVCQLIYLNNGPIVLHESGIAGRCGQHRLAFRKNLENLLEKRKLTVGADGKITNRRVESELTRIVARRRRSSSDPSQTSGIPKPNPPEVGAGSNGGQPSKPLKVKEPTLFGPSIEEKRIEESKGAIAPLPDPEADLFRRGKEVLGKTAGGLIKNLFDAKGGNVALARAAIEQASTKENPREFVGAMIRPGGGRRTVNGFAAVARRLHEAERDEEEGQ